MVAKKKAKPTAKKKRVNGSAKGFSFERKLAVIFGEWWTKGERDDVFWRTEGSGSRATSRAKRGKRTRFQYGDMTFIDPIGQPLIEAFSFEFKNYKTYDLLSVFKQTDPNRSWLVMWAECCIDADLSGREPILITKKNQHPPIMWVTRKLYCDLGFSDFYPQPKMNMQLEAQMVRLKKNKKIDVPAQTVVGFLFDQFIEKVDPRVFEEILYATGRAKKVDRGTGREEVDRGAGVPEANAGAAGSAEEAASADDATPGGAPGGGSADPQDSE